MTSNAAKSQLLKALGYKVLADIVSCPANEEFFSALLAMMCAFLVDVLLELTHVTFIHLTK